jgi:hypothetical protein
MERKPTAKRLSGERSKRDRIVAKKTVQLSHASEFIAQTRFLQVPKYSMGF